ncbi:MAG: hypothetical protein ABIN67_13855 [Ferruginibacter sp.]
MQSYTITLGTGKGRVVLQDAGATILDVLTKLKNAGWQIEHITKIKKF